MPTRLVSARWLLALIALWIWLAPSPAVAQSDDSKARAKQHYDRAVAFEDLKEWDKAIEEYRRAHALFPDPEFHYLIAEVYAKKGDKKAALDHYDKYLAEAPEGRVAGPAKAKADALRPQVAAEEAARKKAAEQEAARKRAAEQAARKKAAEEAARKKALATKKAETPEPATNPGRGLRIAGLATAGGGIVAVGLGVVFGLQATSAQDDVEQQFDPVRDQEGRDAERNMFIAYGIGAAAVVGGGVLYYLGARKGRQAETERRMTVLPHVTRASAGFVLSGRF